MKRVLGIVLGSAMVFAGCSTDEDAATSASFTADYDLGLYVVSAGKTTSETKRYIDLNGTVTQVDSLSAQATTSATAGVCQIDPDMPKTVYSEETSAETSLRIVGEQNAWLLPGTYYPNNNEEANYWGTPYGEGGVHTWGDPSYGDLFFSEPNMDLWIYRQAEAECNCELDQYLKTSKVKLHIFEEEYKDSYIEITKYSDANQNWVDTYKGHSDVDLGTFTRFVKDGYVWETGQINNFYNNNSVQYNADMILPDSVKVGDTWLDNNGALVAAVGIETVAVAGKRVRALHVVYRGSSDVDGIVNGAAKECVDVYESYNEDNNGVKFFGKRASLKATCRMDGESSGWVNQRHVWYYKGLPVKVEESTVSLDLRNYGFVAANDGNLPGGHNGGAGNTVGNCAFYTTAGTNAQTNEFSGDADQLARLQPYAEFHISQNSEVWEAKEIRDNYTIVTEYREDLKASK